MFFERFKISQYYYRVLVFYRDKISYFKLQYSIVIHSLATFIFEPFGDLFPSSSSARNSQQNILELMTQSFHPNHNSKKVSYAR